MFIFSILEIKSHIDGVCVCVFEHQCVITLQGFTQQILYMRHTSHTHTHTHTHCIDAIMGLISNSIKIFVIISDN